MANYSDRYGIPAHEVDNLSARFKHQKLKEGFASFDNFLRFCAESGYKPEMLMRRYDTNAPHSPENTFFCSRPVIEEKNPQKPEKKTEMEPRDGVCASCKKKCNASGAGCSEYQKLWTENWNRNIHRKKPEPERPRARQFFLYEHPDLIREGIVFESSRSM